MKIFTLWKNGREYDETLNATELERELVRIKSRLRINETFDVKVKRLG